MTVTIPPNIVAEIHVPSAAGTMIEEFVSLEDEPLYTNAAEGHATILTRGSGTHRLASAAA